MKKKYIKSLFALILFSSFLFANTTPSIIKFDSDGYKEQIAKINQEVEKLEASQKEAKGEDRLALQLYMFKKNQEIRKVITQAITAPDVDKDFFTSQIKSQQEYFKQAISVLSKRAVELIAALDAANDDKKLTIISQYKEIREFLNLSYEERAENIAWLRQLGINIQAEQSAFNQDISTLLEQISANIAFLKQKKENQSLQLQDAPEAEKENIALAQSITKKQMDIATTSLQITMELADDIGIDTAEYKRLYFDVTGSVTQDLLNKDVLSSIVTDWTERSWAWAFENAPSVIFQLLVVITILFATYQFAALTRKVLASMLANKTLHMSQLMREFFIAMSGRVVWLVGFLIALSQLGINLAPVLAGFGIAGIIIGFALQDTLSNFAAGMMLLIYRPFDVGDFVYAGGVDGKVSHMSLVNTTIKTFDNQIIIVPNSKIWGDVIKNVTHERVRRVDMEFGVSYNDDVEFVESVFLDILTSHPAVLRSPEPMIKVGSLGDSSVNFLVRPWTRTDDYWDVYWDVTREVKIRFDKEGICIPYPQRDVHFYHGVEKAPYLKKSNHSNLDSDNIVKQ